MANNSGIVFKCSYCDKSFKSQKVLKRHEEWHEKKETRNQCKICNKSCSNANEFENHKDDHPDDFPFLCSVCFKRFATEKERDAHEPKHKKKKKKCKICSNQFFDTEEEYLYHIKSEHEGKLIDYYMCSECGKQFKSRGELVHHNKSKCGTVKQYKCKVCGIELMTAGSLHNHMLIHKGERSFMCRFCAKQFVTRGQLKVHERIHTQDKAFVCKVCNKGFCHRQSLITHSTLHTGIKPYQCENCGDSFSCVGNLLKHRRTHADSCGTIPLTTHRVEHPSTRMKVKVNTPETTKLKSVRREKELQEKLKSVGENVKPVDDDPSKNNEADLSDSNAVFNVPSKKAALEMKRFALRIKKNFALKTKKARRRKKYPKVDVKNSIVDVKSPSVEATNSLNNSDEPRIQESKIGNNFDDDSENKDAGIVKTENNDEDSLDNDSFENTGTNDFYEEDSCDVTMKIESEDMSNKLVLDEVTKPFVVANIKVEVELSNSNLQQETSIENIEHTMKCDGDMKMELKYTNKQNNEEIIDKTKNHLKNHEIISEQETSIENVEFTVKTEQNSLSINSEEISHKNLKCLTNEINSQQESSIEKEEHIVKSDDEQNQLGTTRERIIQKKKKHSKSSQISLKELEKFIEERGIKEDKSKSVCKYCKKFYALPRCLLRHEREHKAVLEKLNGKAPGKEVYFCTCCKAPFTTKEECTTHQNTSHNDKLSCKECMKTFSNPNSIRAHKRMFHSGEPRKFYLYVCDKCGMQFKQKSCLKEHVNNECQTGPLVECEVCNKKFSSIHVRKSHMVVHQEEKTLTCSYCQKSFRWKGQLKIHERIHTGEKPFACLYCPKKFAYRESLITHSSLHTGIRPHLCKACGVRFSCISNLIKHRKSKTFTCGAWYAKNVIS